KERTKQVSDFDKFKSEIENGMFLEASWCGDKKCEEKIKEVTGADIRVIPFDNSKTSDPCVNCKKPGKENVIFARGY
ncbi:MAG: proline--tRNA ligase, partial [Thermoproteota archaeon]